MTELLLTVDEFAARARTTPKTVRHWRYTGKGPVGFRVGRRLLYRASEVEAWLEQAHQAAQDDGAA